jgi:chromate transporter
VHKYSLAKLWAVFLRVGNTTFGGGDPTMLALHRELVVRRTWLTNDQYAISFTLARVTPGTNMLAFCVAAGWYLAGWLGAIGAVLAVTIPSALLILWITAAYENWQQNPMAMSAINGTVAAAVGMMLAGSWLLLKPHLRDSTRWLAVILAAGAAMLSLWPRLSPVQVLVMAAVVGYFTPRTNS